MLFEIKEQAQLKNKKHKALITQVINRKMKAKSFPEDLPTLQ